MRVFSGRQFRNLVTLASIVKENLAVGTGRSEKIPTWRVLDTLDKSGVVFDGFDKLEGDAMVKVH